MTTPTTLLPYLEVARRPELRVIPGGKRAEPVQLALDLEWEVAPGIPAVPPVPPHLTVIGNGKEAGADLPDIGRWTARMARAVAEVSVGERPLTQLTRWVSRPELAKLSRRAGARQVAERGRRTAPRTRMVKSVRVCPVAPGIVETSAVLVGAERAQAVAMRFELTAGRWLATAIELG